MLTDREHLDNSGVLYTIISKGMLYTVRTESNSNYNNLIITLYTKD